MAGASGVSGDFAAARKLIRQLKGASESLLGRVQKNLGEESKRLLAQQFRSGVGPYGEPWAPLRGPRIRDFKLGGYGHPLRDTGRLRNSFTYRVRGGRAFILGTNVGYAATHQFGATIRARNAPFLVFPFAAGVRSSHTTVRGRLLRRNVVVGLAHVKQVTIPQRRMVPQGTLGAVWFRAFVRTASRVVRAHFAKKRGRGA